MMETCATCDVPTGPMCASALPVGWSPLVDRLGAVPDIWKPVLERGPGSISYKCAWYSCKVCSWVWKLEGGANIKQYDGYPVVTRYEPEVLPLLRTDGIDAILESVAKDRACGSILALFEEFLWIAKYPAQRVTTRLIRMADADTVLQILAWLIIVFRKVAMNNDLPLDRSRQPTGPSETRIEALTIDPLLGALGLLLSRVGCNQQWVHDQIGRLLHEATRRNGRVVELIAEEEAALRQLMSDLAAASR